MKEPTLLASMGPEPSSQSGHINPPVYRASTILFDSLQDWEARHHQRGEKVSYGTTGTPTTFALAQAVAEIEGGCGAVICSSGLAAVTLAITSLISAGDHILMTDSVYGPARSFCDKVLARFGVEISFYDPMAGAEIASLMRPETKLVFVESPGTFTFEVQDVPAIARAAHENQALVVMDNTWSAGVYFKPFEHGVDLSIQAGTKYQAGHSDLVIGWISARDEDLLQRVRDQVHLFGDIAGPSECWLTLRGLRSMAARLRVHQEAGLELARWLQTRPEVLRVIHPALPGCPGHEIWKRDFTGASSLFGAVLATKDRQALDGMIKELKLFGLGASWGGFKSLIIPAWLTRDVCPPPEDGILIRLHVGLEHVEDLKRDLLQGFKKLTP